MRNRFLCLRCGRIVEGAPYVSFNKCCGSPSAERIEILDDAIPDALPKGVPQWLLDLARGEITKSKQREREAYENGFKSGMACAQRTADPTKDPVEQARALVTDVLRRTVTVIETELDRFQGRRAT